jgi:ribosomal-protein-alanine N-acetyltransferase
MITNLKEITVRSARLDDKSRLANLIHFEPYIHRHLDWRPPLDWIGQDPYLILEKDSETLAALACPPDPADVAWIRLFAVSSKITVEDAWDELWPAAQSLLARGNGSLRVAAIPLQSWFRRVLEEADFKRTHKVIVLIWRPGELPPAQERGTLLIRPMNFDDLPIVEEIDKQAFGSVWQNSLPCLRIAYNQAAVATVAEETGEIVGYQISTSTPMGGHLARLAVNPKAQGKGIGYALVRDMLSQFERRSAKAVTVNTQQDNLISLSLYQKAGFRRTGEEYPVYQFTI